MTHRRRKVVPIEMRESLTEPTSDGRSLILTADPLAIARSAAAGRLLLTPNERAAAASVRATGVPAEHLSLQESAVRHLVNHAGVWRATPEAQVAALRQALYELDPGSDVRGQARVLAPAVRELLRAGFGQALTGLDPSVLGVRARRLMTVTERYRAVLATNGSIDPAESLWRAALAQPVAKRVLVYGYSRLGADELAYLDAVSAPGSVVVLPAGFAANEYAAQHLEARGWTVLRQEAPMERFGVELARRIAASRPAPESDLAEVTAWRAGDQEEEARFVLGRVKALLARGVKAGRIVLVARDEETYGPLLAAVAREYRVPLTLAYTVPIKRARVGGFLALLAETVGTELRYEPTARLLSHRFARLLDPEAWRKAREIRPDGLAGWREAAPDIAALSGLSWPRQAAHGAYLDLLDRTVEALGASAHIAASAREAEAWNALRAALERPESRGAEVTRSEFLSEVDDTLELQAAPADMRWENGVEFHSPLALAGAEYEHVFVLGASEGMLPAPVSDDPMLDFFERAALRSVGLPLEDAPEAAEREVLSFAPVLLAATGSLTLTYPELLAGREQLASPYFATLSLRPKQVPPLATSSRNEQLVCSLQSGGESHPASRSWRVELARESAAPADQFDGVIGPMVAADARVPLDQRTFSATQLLTLGQCPFRWFAQRLLKLAEPSEKEDEAGPLTLGSLFHLTLDNAVRSAQRENPTASTGELRRAVLDELPRAFSAAEHELGTPATPTWPQQRPAHLKTLIDAVSAPDFLLDGSSVLLLEGKFSGTWRGLNVTGFVDRIDTRTVGDEQSLVLTDYKLGKTKPLGAKDSSGKLTLDVQLPLYVETAAPELAPGLPVSSARYFSLNGAETLAEATIDDAELSGLVARVRSHLAEGSFPVDPDSEQRVCTYCDYDSVCRRGPRLGRKVPVTERAAHE